MTSIKLDKKKDECEKKYYDNNRCVLNEIKLENKFSNIKDIEFKSNKNNKKETFINKKRKNENILTQRIVQIKKENTHVLNNSDIVCNILSFLTFAERWKYKIISMSFYNAFNTKYGWNSVDFRFFNIDLLNMNFLDKYKKLLFNTNGLFLSVHENENVEEIINFSINNFKNIKDLRLYFRKKNTNYIYEGIHPTVANLLNNKFLNEKKKKKKKNEKYTFNNTCYAPNQLEDILKFTENETESYHTYNSNNNESEIDNKQFHEYNNINYYFSTFPYYSIDYDPDFSESFFTNCNTFHLSRSKNSPKNSENNNIKNDTIQKYMNILKKNNVCKNLEMKIDFHNLERLVLDVEIKGNDLLCFVGKFKNLKDIIISKLLYSDNLNRSQIVTIFTCFVDKIKQNNIRIIQLGLYFRHEHKKTNYLNNETFRKLLNEHTNSFYDINNEEGDELISILYKKHSESLYCLWSNDLFISYEMYESIKKFRNLKIWTLPGWSALSFAKL
ncbi:conserved Plasmodium protein, unknown function [Plasmodium berghei]|uniref:Uncharacterized protein n=2 Tax=Plasmodium berghei TaxID=5821 RepID=A0A509ANH4_PLABA|nr:conserved Plasmodium protein, unknown function [Plasmodium berghei ANKA]CXI79869.1 conserved Plasmodium protein, unknown function [Plasmodium berghei]SCM25341.1 conserved Plasmodium protein, unknown function [Plasmodium berghei]SCO61976.1 conserved Plasmodium protein, unknown function [Plasmodium berghei]VUC57193.1 conserved Plasmodium protein, unknown function [Plasmodium berghei ANKA]|eukprot:XP_034422972.1 conserved Plasmodium protein, unknown function [Plasmodium berghei ANKA]